MRSSSRASPTSVSSRNPWNRMPANAEIFFEHDRWGRALAWSAGLHLGITAAALIYSAIATGPSGSGWGAGGGGVAIGASLVCTVPLLANSLHTQNELANDEM